MTTAIENNVQVFATTHSWDAQAADLEGGRNLVRLERDLRAVEYPRKSYTR